MDASEPAVLIQAHIARASAIAIAVPDAFLARRVLEIARMVNPGVKTVVRTHSEEESRLLKQEKADQVFLGEHELAASMADYLLQPAAKH